MHAEVVQWLAHHFLPFEPELRRMLRRVCGGPAEVDDVVQESYCKVLSMDGLDHVREPKAFLVRTAKNIVMDRLRREAIVSIETMANLEELEIEDAAPTPERVALARAELRWVAGLIGRLPERCRQVLNARRIEGLSQQETAASLGITVGLVEYETTKAMDLMSEMIAHAGMQGESRGRRPQQPKRAVE